MRFSRRAVVVVSFTAAVGGPSLVAVAPAQAATDLVVTLEEPRGIQAAAPALSTAPSAGSFQIAQSPAAAASAKASSSAKSDAVKRSVARLGVVLKDGTRIYRTASLKGQQLFRCPKGTALGLVGQTKTFYAVLMVDKSLGFVEKSRVELYNAGVTINAEESAATNRLVQIALEYIGVPYVWGGNTRGGIDCSGFVKAVYSRLGIDLPRVARDQYHVGRPVRWGELAPGDRLYFINKGTVIDHTGIYLGNGKFIHASGAHGAVVISSVTEPKYYRTLVGARRS